MKTEAVLMGPWDGVAFSVLPVPWDAVSFIALVMLVPALMFLLWTAAEEGWRGSLSELSVKLTLAFVVVVVVVCGVLLLEGSLL